MRFSKIAASFDAKVMPVEAAWAYEIAIQSTDADVEIYLDLAVLYFECRDFGYASFHRLSEEFVDAAWQRAYIILDQAETKFGKKTDILFWREYFSFIYGNNENFEEIQKQLVQREDSLVPFLFKSANEKEDYSMKRKNLMRSVESGGTERQRYIKSVLGE